MFNVSYVPSVGVMIWVGKELSLLMFIPVGLLGHYAAGRELSLRGYSFRLSYWQCVLGSELDVVTHEKVATSMPPGMWNRLIGAEELQSSDFHYSIICVKRLTLYANFINFRFAARTLQRAQQWWVAWRLATGGQRIRLVPKVFELTIERNAGVTK